MPRGGRPQARTRRSHTRRPRTAARRGGPFPACLAMPVGQPRPARRLPPTEIVASFGQRQTGCRTRFHHCDGVRDSLPDTDQFAWSPWLLSIRVFVQVVLVSPASREYQTPAGCLFGIIVVEHTPVPPSRAASPFAPTQSKCTRIATWRWIPLLQMPVSSADPERPPRPGRVLPPRPSAG